MEKNISYINVDGEQYAVCDETARTAITKNENDIKTVNNVVKKAQLVESISWQEQDLNNYTTEGTYLLKGTRTSGDNMPILNEGAITARLTVLVTESSGNKVVTQVINLNNNAGGEGNVYIRSQQAGTWKPWGKLQTNVEVGQITPDDMSNLTDNGIYSGVCVDGSTVETFVLIVINNYLAASQAGFGAYVSQLKYAINLNRGNTVKTRTRDAYGIWNEWSEIGGYVLPEATETTLGGVKLGTIKDENNYFSAPVIMFKNGLGIRLDSKVLQQNSNRCISIKLSDEFLIDEDKGIRLSMDTRYYTTDTSVVFPLVYSKGITTDGIFIAKISGIPVHKYGGIMQSNYGMKLNYPIDIKNEIFEFYGGSLLNAITGGLIDSNYEYMIRCDISDIYNLSIDINRKIAGHIDNNRDSVSDTVYLFLRKLVPLSAGDIGIIIDCYILCGDSKVKYYKYTIPNFSDGGSTILVSSEMTEL